jgi:hypothetical protein
MAGKQPPKLRELIIRAASDGDFAQMVLNNPEAVAAEYGLEANHVDQIKDLVSQGAFRPGLELHATPETYE